VDVHSVGKGNSCRRRSKIYLHLDYQPMSALQLRSHLNGPSSSSWTRVLRNPRQTHHGEAPRTYTVC
jgi:hypothetical protein